MSNLRTAAHQALKAMETNQYAVADQAPHRDVMAYNATIEELHAALAEPVPEPYAWMAVGGSIWRHKTSEDDVPLYMTPPQRKPLTEEEIRSLSDNPRWDTRVEKIVRAVERAHGIG